MLVLQKSDIWFGSFLWGWLKFNISNYLSVYLLALTQTGVSVRSAGRFEGSVKFCV